MCTELTVCGVCRAGKLDTKKWTNGQTNTDTEWTTFAMTKRHGLWNKQQRHVRHQRQHGISNSQGNWKVKKKVCW